MESFKNFRMYLKDCLKKNEIAESEADDILAYVFKTEKKDFLLIDNIDDKKIRQANKILSRRLKHIPLEKQFKTAFFFGKEFVVNNNVLTPRQDTEILVEKVISITRPTDTILDLCTGSGILAITLVNYAKKVVASDISSKALTVAKKNAKLHNAEIEFVKSNLLEKIDGKFDIIVSNPPYIESKIVHELLLEVKKYDPLIALDGGDDGLKFYSVIIPQAKNYLNKNGWLCFEIGYDQAQKVKDILINNNYVDIEVFKDYSGNDRVILAKLN